MDLKRIGTGILVLAGWLCWVDIRSVAAQAPAPLTIDRLRAVTYRFGPVREQDAVQPMEQLNLLYDINGAKRDQEGKVSIMLRMVWKGPDGAEVAKFETPLSAVHVFGGPVAAFGTATFPPNLPTGQYTMHLTVEDTLAGTTAETVYVITLTAPKFDILNVRFRLDSKTGPERPNRFFVYDKMAITMDVANFSVEGGKVALTMDMEIQDPTGKPLWSFKDFARINETFPPNQPPAASFDLWLNLTQPGSFVAQVTLTDQNSGLTIVRKMPFVVESAN